MSLKKLELKDSIFNKIHIDEYQAKMGNDDDIIVFSFKSKYRDQATDLVNFLEKGYDWILDADVSTGELEDGSYLIFVEVLRRPSFPEKLINLLQDLENVTGITDTEYEFQYSKETKYAPITIETLTARVPLDPRKYRKRNKNQDDIDLENLQMAAGLAPKSEEITDPELKRFVNLSKY